MQVYNETRVTYEAHTAWYPISTHFPMEFVQEIQKVEVEF